VKAKALKLIILKNLLTNYEYLLLFAKNSKHPSLKLHKLKGQRSVQFSIWIKGDLRALYIKDKQDIIFVDILNHDEY